MLAAWTTRTRTDLEVVGAAGRPKLGLLEGVDLPEPRGHRGGAGPRHRARRRAPVRSAAASDREGDAGAGRAHRTRRGRSLAAHLPAFRPYVIDRLIEAAARRNARLALMIFIPGADMPVLTAMQMHLVLRIAACYGEEISPAAGDRAAGRARARASASASWPARCSTSSPSPAGCSRAAIAYGGTRAVGTAAVRVLRARRRRRRVEVRAFAEGARVELQQLVDRVRSEGVDGLRERFRERRWPLAGAAAGAANSPVMHEQTILIPAAPPAGHRARLLMQTALFLLVPVVILLAVAARDRGSALACRQPSPCDTMLTNDAAASRAANRGRSGDGAEAVPLHRRRGQPGAEAHGDRSGRALLPRRVRGRDLQPGAADPLHAGQRARRRFAAERVYCPWPDMADAMRREGVPLFTLESWRPVREVDLLGITLQAELTYSNVLEVLDLAGHPGACCDRGEDDPIVMAGGPSASNPEPLAPFFDAFFMGESEEAFEPCSTCIGRRPAAPRALASARRAPVPLRARARPPRRCDRAIYAEFGIETQPIAGRRARTQRDLLARLASRSCAAAPAAAASATPARGTGRCASGPADEVVKAGLEQLSLHGLRRALADVARHERLHRRRAGHRARSRRAAATAPVAAIQPGRHGAGGDDRGSERAPGFDHARARGGDAADARHHLQDHHRRDDREAIEAAFKAGYT